jgi:hypothetical protein
MFDRDELDEIQSDRRRWSSRGDDEIDRTVSKRRFAGSMASSVVAVSVLIAMVMSMNLAMGVGIGQVGGFVAKFPKLEGETLNIYPAVSESSACLNNVSSTNTLGRPTSNSDEVGIPVLKADIKKANITELPVALVKDIRLPDVIPPIDVVRINLTQTGDLSGNTVNIGDASLHLHSLEAERIILEDGAQIRENYSGNGGSGTSDPIFGPSGNYKNRGFDYGEFSITGTNATMVNGTAEAHLLAFDRLTMPNMSLQLEYNPPKPWQNKTNNNCGGLF